MKDLAKLLKKKGIRKAVIIDDVFDDMPQPDELDPSDWSIFFDDLTGKNYKLLLDLYPRFEDADEGSLQMSREFIEILWENRSKLSVEPLFEEYEKQNASERENLNNIVQKLENVGLICMMVGRDFEEKVKEADLIVMDLFLGPQEDSHDLEPDIERVRNLIANRADNPPLIILISSSPYLDRRKNEFRDKAGLLSSTFRVAQKSELIEDGKLELILSRLASHYEDAKRLSGFLYAWDQGIESTRKSFLQRLRRLDLHDLAQIRTLLLNSEGGRLGDYLLDITDRVLQHEIEGRGETIIAAQNLNEVDLNRYPAPHLTGTSDFRDLVHRMMFTHQHRLRLAEDGGVSQIRFGDVLCQREKNARTYTDDVWLVVTPACDLVRSGTRHIMLIPGKLQEFRTEDWSYRNDLARTSIIILPNGQRKWIKWNLKEILTQNRDDLNNSLNADQGECREIIARFREVYALSLQQKLLTRMGRIGLTADLPASFPVEISLYYIDTESSTKDLMTDNSISGVCYIGRDEKSNLVHHLVITEQACDQVRCALLKIPEESVLQRAIENLREVKKDLGFILKLQQGEVELPPQKGGMKFISSEDKTSTYAAVIRGNTLSHEKSIDNFRKYKKAPIIIQVVDLLEERQD